MNCGVRCKTALENLVPTDDLASLAVEELLGMVDHEALQVHLGAVLVVALDAQGLDTCLALRTLLPLCLWTLVTTDVDVL